MRDEALTKVGTGSEVGSRVAMLLLWTVAIGLLYASTLRSMVETWMSSQSFSHGFIIAPISGWLIWRLRGPFIPRLRRRPAPLLLLLMPIAALGWLAGELVSVQLVMQLAFVTMLVLGLAAIMGLSAALVVAFPLGFLYLAVPMGTGLEQPMMDLTAEFTVKLIQWSGVPVYREGLFFQLPTGSWSVVEACSGVRYLTASITLGLLFAHLSYRSRRKQLIFVLAAIAVPVVANVLRAYQIVMLGHLSHMQFFTGIEHIIYGWVFFGLVMLLMFWVGGKWADAPSELLPDPSGDEVPDTPGRHGKTALVTLAVALAIAAIPPAQLGLLSAGQAPASLITLSGLGGDGWECRDGQAMTWYPRDGGADRRVGVACDNDGIVQIVADQYLRQEQGREVADYVSGLKGEDTNRWRLLSSRSVAYPLADGSTLPARESVLRRNATGEKVVVAAWYLVNDRATASPVEVKIHEALLKVRGKHRSSARVFLAAEVSDTAEIGVLSDEVARNSLRSFVASRGQVLNRTIGLPGPTQ